MRALLISTYDLGRQPLGLASPAASLRAAGVDVECVDTSRSALLDEQIAGAALVAFYLPMHTATRLAAPMIARVRRLNPSATLAAYGLYAPLNADWLREQGVAHVIPREPEPHLVALITATEPGRPLPEVGARHRPLVPDRTRLPPLARYAAVQMPDGSRRVAGNTDATYGCRHLCRHCPIVPVYQGTFRAIPLDVVLEDVRAQVSAGAQHITFGDPDFFNGPTHARRLVERLHRELPDVTYDVTIKIEHLLRHRDMLPLLRETGCLFITSAAESIDDRVLAKLRKGHTREDFVRAVGECRRAGVALSPTFVPFTPWTTVDGYVELLAQIDALGLVEQVAPIQLAIRLLVTAQSALLELDDLRASLEPFDREALAWPWRHPDPAVDALQGGIMQLVAECAHHSRTDLFAAIMSRACAAAGRPAPRLSACACTPAPMMTEAWYCCAEPLDALPATDRPEPRVIPVSIRQGVRPLKAGNASTRS